MSMHRKADHHHGAQGHGHAHGVIDPTIASTERGVWALKWSFVGLLVTALVQLAIVLISGSVALLADTIHNFADAATAIPLWIAFALAGMQPGRRFSYGYGRMEDLAGVAVVMTILFSAIIAGYQSLLRLIRPEPMAYLGAVLGASVLGRVCKVYVTLNHKIVAATSHIAL
jgi:cation diffusion facilitator family transporter